MRRSLLGSAVLLALPFAAFGPVLWSGGKNAKTPDTPAAPAPRIAKSKIDKVTVYPNSALVTREVEVPDGNGLVELTVTQMPDRIVPSTMYSEAGDGLRVLTTRFTTRVVLEDTSEARRSLESELEKVQVTASKIDSDLTSLHKNMDLLTKLETVAQVNKLTGDEVIAMSKYVMEQRTEKAKAIVDVQELKRLNNIQLNFVQRKMGELGRGSGKMERDAIIVVDREAGKGGKIRLNYLVSAVTWRPEYKVRAGKVSDDVQLDYLANLMQHSGEDWNQVKMTLSTAQPLLNASPPELCMLQPVLVRRGGPGGPPMPGGGGFGSPFANPTAPMDLSKQAMTQRDYALQLGQGGEAKGGKGAPKGINPANSFDVQKETERLLNEAAAIEQNLDLMRSPEEVIADKAKKKQPIAVGPAGTDGPSVTYHLPNKLTVPSRNDEQVVEVAKLKLAPKYYYKTVPVLNTNVYRLADLVNKSEHILLPGEATMYQGTDFVGRMPMPLVAIGEEFTAGFGVETQLQVQRQMIDQNRSTQGGNQVLKYDYRILVSSFKSQPVQLQVWDRLPKGENESVGVVLLKTAPELSKDGIYLRESRPNNLLRWDIEVPANCNGEKALPISYEFRMELDRQMAITGFQSK
jgi:Domain of unknown function (DUF4139)/N-terminal domain of unknown function (DUF4140)